VAYLYRHIRLDKNIPFYIGIGIDSNYYRANSKKSRNDHWNKIVNKTDYEVEILFEHEDYNFIKEKEKEFISLYGRKDTNNGMLVNMTDGGDGCLGLIHSDEAKLKMSIPNKGKIISEEQKRKVSEFHKGKVTSKETRLKMSEASKGDKNSRYGKTISEDTRNKMIGSAKRGSENVTAKLNEEDVISIRKMYKTKEYTYLKLAEIYGISRSNIKSILNRNTWKHI
jgi:hypothetical protein